MSFTVAPGLLIAMPTLLDPNFFRSVVLLCAHSDEGAFGVIVNQPLDVTVESICTEAGMDWSGGETPAYAGGPVERHRGWVLHADGREFAASQKVSDDLAITTSQDGLEAYCAEPDGRYRLLLGYAGWGPSQLDQEIGSGAWLTAPLKMALIFDTAPHHIWRDALRSVGVDPTHLVDGGSHIN